MKQFILTVLLLSVLAISPALAQENIPATLACPAINDQKVMSFFDNWNNALKSKHPDTVATLYAKDAILLPTFSALPRTSRQEIRNYFVNFLKLSPVGKIDQRFIKLGCGWALDAGTYSFTVKDEGENKIIKARYTFVYNYIDGQWLIINQHSSIVPEEDEVKEYNNR